MLKKRIIPVLLLRDSGLVKGINFSSYRYLGDPMNAIKIFNDKKVDELIFLDIDATNEQSSIDCNFVRKIADECYMPFAVGGGISNIEQIKKLLRAGAEKVVINSSLFENIDFLNEAADTFGSQSLIVSVDIGHNWFKKKTLYRNSGEEAVNFTPAEWIKKVIDNGAGEILINCIYKDGVMKGYDLDYINFLSSDIKVPVIVCGGASCYSDFRKLFDKTKVQAGAAGSVFVYHGKHNAVLINYPDHKEKEALVK